MAYYMHIAAGDSGDHRLCIGRFVMWCKNRLMKTGNNQIQRVKHFTAAINFTINIFNVSFDAAQDPYPINHSRPDTHVNEVPVMRSIFHIRAMIGDRKKFNALLFGLGNVITQCAICMRAGNGMHMKVDGIHNSLLYSIPAKDSRKPDALLVAACAVDLPADPLPFFELGNGARNVIHSFSGTGNRGDMWCYRHAWMLPERTFRR